MLLYIKSIQIHKTCIKNINKYIIHENLGYIILIPINPYSTLAIFILPTVMIVEPMLQCSPMSAFIHASRPSKDFCFSMHFLWISMDLTPTSDNKSPPIKIHHPNFGLISPPSQPPRACNKKYSGFPY